MKEISKIPATGAGGGGEATPTNQLVRGSATATLYSTTEGDPKDSFEVLVASGSGIEVFSNYLNLLNGGAAWGYITWRSGISITSITNMSLDASDISMNTNTVAIGGDLNLGGYLTVAADATIVGYLTAYGGKSAVVLSKNSAQIPTYAEEGVNGSWLFVVLQGQVPDTGSLTLQIPEYFLDLVKDATIYAEISVRSVTPSNVSYEISGNVLTVYGANPGDFITVKVFGRRVDTYDVEEVKFAAINKLYQLKSQGTITLEEFQTASQKIALAPIKANYSVEEMKQDILNRLQEINFSAITEIESAINERIQTL